MEPVVCLAVYILRLNHNSSVFLVVCCSLAAAPRPSFRLFRLSPEYPAYPAEGAARSLFQRCFNEFPNVRLYALIVCKA